MGLFLCTGGVENFILLVCIPNPELILLPAFVFYDSPHLQTKIYIIPLNFKTIQNKFTLLCDYWYTAANNSTTHID